MTRWTVYPDPKKENSIEIEYLLTSLSKEKCSPELLLQMDRAYWGIESSLHHRLDCSALEDQSRVRLPNSALNLGMIRRAVNTVAVAWIKKCPNKRNATTSGFYDAMRAHNSKKAFSLLTAWKPSWYPS